MNIWERVAAHKTEIMKRACEDNGIEVIDMPMVSILTKVHMSRSDVYNRIIKALESVNDVAVVEWLEVNGSLDNDNEGFEHIDSFGDCKLCGR